MILGVQLEGYDSIPGTDPRLSLILESDCTYEEKVSKIKDLALKRRAEKAAKEMTEEETKEVSL